MKTAKVKPEIEIDKNISIKEEIDVLVQNAEEALKAYVDFDQQKVDKIVHAMALAGLEHHRELAKLAHEETQRGVYEDKIIKNIFSTEYIWNSIKDEKTVGIVEDNDRRWRDSRHQPHLHHHVQVIDLHQGTKPDHLRFPSIRPEVVGGRRQDTV